MRNFLSRRWLQGLAAVAGIGVIGVGVVLAEDVWVQRPVAQLRAGKGSLYDVVVEVPQNTQLTVIEKDANWIHVKYQDKDGWIANTSVSRREVKADKFASLRDSDSSGMTSGASAKGFTPDDFAKAKGYNEQPLKDLEAMVKANVTPTGFEKFEADGKVGNDKGKP